jgi:hypothetical protein
VPTAALRSWQHLGPLSRRPPPHLVQLRLERAQAALQRRADRGDVEHLVHIDLVGLGLVAGPGRGSTPGLASTPAAIRPTRKPTSNAPSSSSRRRCGKLSMRGIRKKQLNLSSADWMR